MRLACDIDSAKLLRLVGLQDFTAGNVDRSILIFDVKGVGCTRMKPTSHATIGEERTQMSQCSANPNIWRRRLPAPPPKSLMAFRGPW